MTQATQQAETDVLIFGGGIAGLWLLARLRQAGNSALLLERHALGGIQTLASQGIIHGGTKYALTGSLTDSAQAIGAMPGLWRACLHGEGELDLSRVQVLSDHQYLWSTGGLVSGITGFFAGKAMHSRVRTVHGNERPEVLRHPAFKGSVYRLEEPVVDVHSLVAELVRQAGEHCLSIKDSTISLVPGDRPEVTMKTSDGRGLKIRARRVVLTAGAGNEELLRGLGWDQPAMQRRPLHMLMLKGPLPPFHAHCLGAGAVPRLTLTSYPLGDETVWYLGGHIAEAGVDQTPEELAKAGLAELREVLPWLDLTQASWSTLRVDRAEPRQSGGLRPASSFLSAREGIYVGWPTKLAFAPQLARSVLDHMVTDGIRPGGAAGSPDWPLSPVGHCPWEEATWN